MVDAPFDGRDRWIAAVERALARPDARAILGPQGIDRALVLAVARVEASDASDSGESLSSHARLAELTGLPRSSVLRARLVLIELGLEVLAAAPGSAGSVQRRLCHNEGVSAPTRLLTTPGSQAG